MMGTEEDLERFRRYRELLKRKYGSPEALAGWDEAWKQFEGDLWAVPGEVREIPEPYPVYRHIDEDAL